MGDRRDFIKSTLGATGMFSLSTLSEASSDSRFAPVRILCIGGHPDDPESGCGGTLAKFSAEKNDVSVLYLTRGEAGIPGKTQRESAEIRTKEANSACAILGAKAIYAGQIDGATVVDEEWTTRITNIVKNVAPEIVFTHWPFDTHKDHQAASILAFRSWLNLDQGFQLYFFEVCVGNQTINFHPTDYVDITATQEIKRKAIFAHASQNPAGIYECGHASMEDFRGREINVKAAEAFVKARRRMSV
jgi:LmbE family N-acetylglucosaminyl deacetylase